MIIHAKPCLFDVHTDVKQVVTIMRSQSMCLCSGLCHVHVVEGRYKCLMTCVDG